jgi:hypothetical protein
VAKRRQEPRPHSLSETSAAEAVTVAWLLAVMTALVCELGSAASLWLGRGKENIALLGSYLFFAALVVGAVSLILAGVVLRVRRVRPPHGVTILAIVVGLAPLVALLLPWLR